MSHDGAHERLCVICFVVWQKKQKKTKNVDKKQRRIYLTFAFSERHVIIMSPRVTVKRWTYDNAQRHVTAFRPISEAAHSWSYDKLEWPVVACISCIRRPAPLRILRIIRIIRIIRIVSTIEVVYETSHYRGLRLSGSATGWPRKTRRTCPTAVHLLARAYENCRVAIVNNSKGVLVNVPTRELSVIMLLSVAAVDQSVWNFRNIGTFKVVAKCCNAERSLRWTAEGHVIRCSGRLACSNSGRGYSFWRLRSEHNVPSWQHGIRTSWSVGMQWRAHVHGTTQRRSSSDELQWKANIGNHVFPIEWHQYRRPWAGP